MHDYLCERIVDCRNKLCHVNGSTVATDLLNGLWPELDSILDLMRFFGLLSSSTTESRITILSKDVLCSDPLSVIEDTGWSDITLLVSKLYGIDLNKYRNN